MEFEEIFKKEFYIVDCKNFIYFPRTVKIIGFEASSASDETSYITDIEEPLIHENRKMYLGELEKFKSFKEAQKEAERLNNIEENKKRAKEWNSIENIYLRQCLKESENK